MTHALTQMPWYPTQRAIAAQPPPAGIGRMPFVSVGGGVHEPRPASKRGFPLRESHYDPQREPSDRGGVHYEWSSFFLDLCTFGRIKIDKPDLSPARIDCMANHGGRRIPHQRRHQNLLTLRWHDILFPPEWRLQRESCRGPAWAVS
jgi:hypothetical protein